MYIRIDMGTSTPIIALKMLAGNEPTHLNAMQLLLAPYVRDISIAWFAIWCLVALVLLVRLIREYRTQTPPQV